MRAYYPDATILRSNVIYGEEDNFLNLMAKYTKIWGTIPIMGSGSNMLQPVYVDDVAECVRAAVFENVHAGKTYELNGPDKISLYKTAQCTDQVCGGVQSYGVRPHPRTIGIKFNQKF